MNNQAKVISTQMTPREREIRERLAKATPGPWTKGLNPNVGLEYYDEAHDILYGADGYSLTEDLRPEDAEFIAHAPTDITYLLAQLTTAREIIEVAKRALHSIDLQPDEIGLSADDASEAHQECWFRAHRALARITEMEKEK